MSQLSLRNVSFQEDSARRHFSNFCIDSRCNLRPSESSIYIAGLHIGERLCNIRSPVVWTSEHNSRPVKHNWLRKFVGFSLEWWHLCNLTFMSPANLHALIVPDAQDIMSPLSSLLVFQTLLNTKIRKKNGIPFGALNSVKQLRKRDAMRNDTRIISAHWWWIYFFPPSSILAESNVTFV